MESDEVPIITNIDDPWPEDDQEEKEDIVDNKGDKKVKGSTEKVTVKQGERKEDDLEETAITEINGDNGLQVEAEVVPEVATLSVAERMKPVTTTVISTPKKQRKVEGAEGTQDGGSGTVEEPATSIVISERTGEAIVDIKVSPDWCE